MKKSRQTFFFALSLAAGMSLTTAGGGGFVLASSTTESASAEHDHSSHDHGDDHSGHSMNSENMTVDVSPEQKSTWGNFVVRLDHGTDTLPLNKMHKCTIEIVDKEGNPVDGAMIMVDGGMPAHGHGLPTVPKVTKNLGSGKYLVEGVKFSMPGMWQLTFHIHVNDEKDVVIFNFKV